MTFEWQKTRGVPKCIDSETGFDYGYVSHWPKEDKPWMAVAFSRGFCRKLVESFDTSEQARAFVELMASVRR